MVLEIRKIQHAWWRDLKLLSLRNTMSSLPFHTTLDLEPCCPACLRPELVQATRSSCRHLLRPPRRLSLSSAEPYPSSQTLTLTPSALMPRMFAERSQD